MMDVEEKGLLSALWRLVRSLLGEQNVLVMDE